MLQLYAKLQKLMLFLPKLYPVCDYRVPTSTPSHLSSPPLLSINIQITVLCTCLEKGLGQRGSPYTLQP